MRLLLSLVVILFSIGTNAQEIRVLDIVTSSPLSNVAIYNSGKTKSTLKAQKHHQKAQKQPFPRDGKKYQISFSRLRQEPTFLSDGNIHPR